MSRTLSIINAGNIFARNFLKSVKGYDKIILGDICNNRKSVNSINLVFIKQKFKTKRIKY